METGDCRDLPMELLTEIFICLPLKSLIRLAAVCKSWFHLIRKDHQFALRHYLTRTRPSPTMLMDNVDYLVEFVSKNGHHRGCGFSIHEGDNKKMLYIHSLTENKTFRPLKRLEFGAGLGVNATNIVHGLMCFRVMSSSRGVKLFLCNPAIREVLPVPIPNNLESRAICIIAFGFDRINNNYKIVALKPPELCRGRTPWQVNLYSVRDGCWRSLSDIGSLAGFSTLSTDLVVNANGRVINWFGDLKSNYKKKKSLVIRHG
ncbi:hypothetical protein DM860_011035 [Cuscuta australis]|uniref:F-box domain-containing protein n=1 Tax=Cuscuta australis TaxID=267555 RepID=A0A328E511_9ASTE|nr:hypothetical protein DM860_011035 [Cuscuta australis]